MRAQTLINAALADGVPDPGVLWPEILRMLDTARYELNRHLGERGVCVLCGVTWPCTRAVLAAFALEAV